MGRITISETIAAPVETVFAYVDDHRNTTKYMQGLSKWKPASDVTHGKGAKFDVAMKAGPATIDSVVEINAWTQNRTIGWRSISGFKQSGKWMFKAAGKDATEATFDTEFEFGGFAGRMLSRAAEPVVRSNLQRSVKALKQQAERAATHKPAAKHAAPAAAKGKVATSAKRTATKR